MKLTKQSNNIKSRIVSVLAIIALVLCTVLSFVLIVPSGDALAESNEDITKKREANGIKFAQVAAGDGFAIGLTYDGKLYGWSLKENRISDTDSSATLGDYYTPTPTEIKVTFRVGPKSNYTWSATGGSENYHSERTDDSIKSIAATRNTAAFITKLGYIYTWGKDIPYDVDHNESGQSHHLLLRSTTESDTIKCSWKVPYIIDYYYFGSTSSGTAAASKTPLEQCIPTISDSFTALAAGEYNYAFMFIRNYPGNPDFVQAGNYYHTYVWGSMLYNAVNTIPDKSFDFSSTIQGSTSTKDARSIFNTQISEKTGDQPTTGVSIVAGGYTVGINNRNTTISRDVEGNRVYGTSLQLRGRNFITTQNVGVSGTNYTVQKTTQVISGNADGIADTKDSNQAVNNDHGRAVASIVSGTNTIVDAIAGGNGRDSQDGSLYGRDVEQYYARQKATNNFAYGIANESQKLINSRGTEIDGLAATRYAVSLGNDIGYGINNGNIYAWGDNANGQLQLADEYKDTPTQILGSKGATFISVAAGKQLSKTKPFSANVTSLEEKTVEGGGTVTVFKDEVKNDDKYISAALTSSGTIYAWSKDIEAQELYFQEISDTNKKESFIAIYSGYGENLFAVTASGKLVRITVSGNEFVQHTYDEFNNASGTKIDNWTVNSTNKVVFKVPEIAEDATKEQQVNPDLGNATFYVWSVAPSDSAAETKTIQINGNATATPYNALVGVNNIGDAYRIIGYKEADKNINFLKADNLSGEDEDITKDNYYAPRYYFDGKLMSDAQRNNMFVAEVVYDNSGAGVGIYIKPLKSSKGKDITVKFKIARYNNYTKYSVAGGNVSDNAIYYDYKECTITFSIEDTPTVMTYDAYGADLNSNIPLLDPNNPNNMYYSLAVQNASLGVDKLIQHLTGAETVNTGFKNAIVAQMNAKDPGFPSSGKIEAGDLKYYLNEVDQGKYNDVYQFLFTDRDSDRVVLEHLGSGGSTDPIISEQSKGVNGAFRTIEVKVKLADTVKVDGVDVSYGLGSDFSEMNAAEILKEIMTEFDNVYGLYGFAVDNDKNLTFKYDVVMFTATDSSGQIKYTANTTDGTTQVNGYETASGGARASFYSKTLIDYSYDDNKGYTEGNKYTDRERNNNIAYVYSQPTLRLKTNLEGASKVVDVNGSVDGSKNTYTVNYTKDLYVGDSVTIKLEDYVNHINTANISFAYENSSATSDLANFSNKFKDFTGQNMKVFSLTANTFTVSPTTAAPINFTISVQRFAKEDQTVHFTSKESKEDDEIIYLTFNFNNIIGFKLSKHANVQTTYLVTDVTTIELFGDATSATAANKTALIDIMGQNNKQLQGNSDAGNAYASLKANAKIYSHQSSETGKTEAEQLFTSVVDDTKITITPKRSGTGTIQFSVNTYDKSESFILTINVSSKTTMDTVTIIDSLSIPISDINKVLVDSNSFNPDVVAGNYKILYKDIKNPEATNDNNKLYNAIYFTSDSDEGYPPFVQNVVFEKLTTTEPTLRIIPSNSTVVKNNTYYMHIKFVNTADSNYTSYENVPAKSIIEIIIPVVSGKIKLQAKEGGDLVANIDCRHEQSDDNKWWTKSGEKLNTTATIPLSYLLELAGTQGPETYKVFLVSADSEAAQYFQYDKGDDDTYIVITAKDNTPKNFEVSVSAYSGNTTTVVSFEVSVKGILTTLPVMTDDDDIIGYGNIWLYSFAIVFGVLLIIFVIRFIVYMRKRAKQRAIIKRNQELIRLRDRMHGKANAATREQLVKAKLKMDDPKYAKAFNDMRRDKEEESGVTLENSDLAATAEKKSKKKKKKGGKKTVAELKAELAAKKAAFAAAQAGNAQPVNPFATEVPIDGGGFVPPDGGFGAPDGGGFVTPDDGGFVTPEAGFATPDAGYATPDIDGNEIVFDASDIGDGNM